MQEFETIDLQEYVHVLKKRWWIVMLTFILFVGVSTGISYFILDPVYEARTTLFVGKEQQNNSNTSLQYNDVMLNQQLVKDYRVLAQSKIVTQEVIRKMKLPFTAEELATKIQVNLQGDTRIIEMKVSDTDPELAKNIANNLSQIFIEKVEEIIKVENVQVVDKAETPTAPVSPRKSLNIAIAGILGIMLSVFFIFLLEYLDNTIKTAEDIERYLGLTTIGNIPLMNAEDLK